MTTQIVKVGFVAPNPNPCHASASQGCNSGAAGHEEGPNCANPTSPNSLNLRSGLANADLRPCLGAPQMKKRGLKAPKPIVRWNMEQLDAVEAGTRIRKVVHGFGIPCSTLTNRLFGTITS